jgi:hypothetical protein
MENGRGNEVGKRHKGTLEKTDPSGIRPGKKPGDGYQDSSSRECEPSQNGAFLLCLQPHQATFPLSLISTTMGERSVPVWDPSQNG